MDSVPVRTLDEVEAAKTSISQWASTLPVPTQTAPVDREYVARMLACLSAVSRAIFALQGPEIVALMFKLTVIRGSQLISALSIVAQLVGKSTSDMRGSIRGALEAKFADKTLAQFLDGLNAMEMSHVISLLSLVDDSARAIPMMLAQLIKSIEHSESHVKNEYSLTIGDKTITGLSFDEVSRSHWDETPELRSTASKYVVVLPRILPVMDSAMLGKMLRQRGQAPFFQTEKTPNTVKLTLNMGDKRYVQEIAQSRATGTVTQREIDQVKQTMIRKHVETEMKDLKIPELRKERPAAYHMGEDLASSNMAPKAKRLAEILVDMLNTDDPDRREEKSKFYQEQIKAVNAASGKGGNNNNKGGEEGPQKKPKGTRRPSSKMEE